jgi:glycosyltransferase involved in cell wall biosynthesis
MLHGISQLEADVHLASSTYTSETEWRPVPDADLRAAGVSRIHVHRGSTWMRRFLGPLQKRYASLERPLPLDSAAYAPPGLCRWFARLARALQPDVVLISYAFWGRLVTPSLHRAAITVMDALDLVSLYRPRLTVMNQFLGPPPYSPDRAAPEFLREEFFDTYGFEVSDEEYRIYDAFTYTIAITPADAALIRSHSPRTRVVEIPMTHPVRSMSNAYDGHALYTAWRNPFNVQGYLYFAARVLPRILEEAPGFQLNVTGGICQDLTPGPGIRLRGFVADLDAEYRSAPFLVCPILGKTGQQIKIVEAMAHGVPVIATQASALGSPIRHGANGLVAKDAREFADYAVRLWQDRDECRRLGAAARETIAEEFSSAQLAAGLSQIFSSPSRPA